MILSLYLTEGLDRKSGRELDGNSLVKSARPALAAHSCLLVIQRSATQLVHLGLGLACFEIVTSDIPSASAKMAMAAVAVAVAAPCDGQALI